MIVLKADWRQLYMKKYVSATMDWTLKIEVSGESSGKILKHLTAHILARAFRVPLIVISVEELLKKYSYFVL